MAEKLLRDKIGYKPGQGVLLLDLPEEMDNPFAGVDHTVVLAKEAGLKFDLAGGAVSAETSSEVETASQSGLRL